MTMYVSTTFFNNCTTIGWLQIGLQKQEFGKNQPKHSVRINWLYRFYNTVLYMLFFVSCIYFYIQKDLPVHLCWGGPQSLDLEERSVQLRNENTPKYLEQRVKYSNRGIESERRTHCMRLCAKGLQLCPALCDSMDCTLPGFSVRSGYFFLVEIGEGKCISWLVKESIS